MAHKLKIFTTAALLSAASGEVQHLTSDTFDDVVLNSGRNSFIKFFAPWCGHCKAMRPAWDALGEEHTDSGVNIADVDCTTQDELCSKYDVAGFPTLKYYDVDEGKLKSYDGGRDEESLKEFAETTLLPKCSVADSEKCNEKEKKYIAKYKSQSYDAVETEYQRLDGMKSEPMKAAQKSWLMQRLRLLAQMRDPSVVEEEKAAQKAKREAEEDADMDDDESDKDL